MAFPTIEDVTESFNAVASTNLIVSMPAVVNAGDLLLLLISPDGSAAAGISATGWTSKLSNAFSSSARIDVQCKIADGSEAGGTVTFTCSSSKAFSAQLYRISGWYGNLGGVEVSSAVGATTASPDPPSLTPSAGALDYLWIATCVSSSSRNLSGIPTNYTNGLKTTDGSTTVIFSARRFLNAASEDPGTFSLAGSSTTNAATIAVRPAVIPTISDCSPSSFKDADSGIVLTGTNFGASQGAGTVKLSPTDNVNDAGVVSQTVTSWGDTSIAFTVDATGLSPGTVYVFVTNSDGNSNASGFTTTLELIPVVSSATPSSFKDGDTGIVISGSNFQSSQGTGVVKLSPTNDINDAGAVEQTVTAWTDTSITIDIVATGLIVGTIYAFVKNDAGYSNASGLAVTLESAIPDIPPAPNFSTRGRLEDIYAAVNGHIAPPTEGARSEYWLLKKIGQVRGIDLTSGLRSREDNYIRLYENLTGNTYNGVRSVEMILRRIEADV